MIKSRLLLIFLFIAPVAFSQQDAALITSLGNTANDSIKNFGKWLQLGKMMTETDTAKALKYFVNGIQVLKKSNRFNELGYAYRAAGELLFRNKKYQQAPGQYQLSKYYFEQAKNKSELPDASLAYAKALYYRGNYRLASDEYVEAIKLAQESNNKKTETEALESLGLLYSAFQIFSKSISTLEKALLINNNLKNDTGSVRITEILTNIHYRKRNFDSALYFASVTMNAAAKLKMTHEMQIAHLNKIAALTRLKKLQEAGEEISLFSKVVMVKQDMNLFVRYHSVMGNYFLAKDDSKTAQCHYDSAIRQARTYYFPEMFAIVYGNMAESYFDKGDYKSGFDYLQKYNEIINAMYSGENIVKLGNLENIFRSSLSRNEIRYLNNENKLKELQLLRASELRKNLERENLFKDSILKNEKLLSEALSRENLYKNKKLENEMKLRAVLSREHKLQTDKLHNEERIRLILLAGLGLVLLLSGVIFYQYTKQKRKNTIIEKQTEELKTLMREIHHRVKNNLQVISSLLDLQSQSIKDSQASQAVREGKNRVLSMALIHQNLYGDKNIKKIKVKDYISNLSRGLIDSYNIEPNSIRIDTDIDDLNLDVDTVIPLGLILNELISNSLKYAFKNCEQGEICVLLKEEENSLLLKVKDNGRGFPPGINLTQSASFGMKLIKAFAMKLKAKLEMYNDGGACVAMQIHKYKPVL